MPCAPGLLHYRDPQFCPCTRLRHSQWFRTSLWEGQPFHTAVSNCCRLWWLSPELSSLLLRLVCVVEAKLEGWELQTVAKWVVTPWSNVGERGENVTEPFLLQLSVINRCLSNEIKGGKSFFFSFFFFFFCQLSSTLGVNLMHSAEAIWQGTIAP